MAPYDYIPASQGDKVTISVYAKIINGTLGSLVPKMQFREYANGIGGAWRNTAMTLTSNRTRHVYTDTILGASTNEARAISIINLLIPAEISYDFTVRIWAPQFEVGEVSSPILTTDIAVTRAAEKVQFANTNWFDGTKGTWFFRASSEDQTNWRYLLDMRPQTGLGSMSLQRSSDAARFFIWDDGGTQENANYTGPWPQSELTIQALSYKTNDIATVVSGGSVVADDSATLPTGTFDIHIGGGI